MKNLGKTVLIVVDAILSPLVAISAFFLLCYRRVGSHRLLISTKSLEILGLWPLIRHYYEPRIHVKEKEIDFKAIRSLPGIEINLQSQLEFLRSLKYASELAGVFHHVGESLGCLKPKSSKLIAIENSSFCSGDAEFLYQFLRATRPCLVIEIGCGISTQIISSALERNNEGKFPAKHVCIEPFEAPWLDQFPGIDLIRCPLENVETELFERLQPGDLLFIDSSHIVRPNGDVLSEILEILPVLREGVNIHIHDIFTPREYLKEFLVTQKFLWNEQYLLEAFLSCNRDFEIVAALNYLKHEAFYDLQRVAPFLTTDREPGSIYIKRVGGKSASV